MDSTGQSFLSQSLATTTYAEYTQPPNPVCRPEEDRAIKRRLTHCGNKTGRCKIVHDAFGGLDPLPAVIVSRPENERRDKFFRELIQRNAPANGRLAKLDLIITYELNNKHSVSLATTAV
jgi:hypothetical protein